MGRNNDMVAQHSGQSELKAEHPAQRGRGPSKPSGPHGPFHGSESTNVGDPPASPPSAGGAALHAASPASGPAER
eukprot:1416041-Alexandrium_andersonii.AAC.1